MSTALKTVKKFMRLTNEKGDIKSAVGLMADDIEFIGPAAKCKSKEEYAALLEQFLSAHNSWKLHQTFENGNEVCFINDIQVNTPNGGILTLELVEWFKVENGKIKRHKVFYDPTEFKKAFGM
ncbi:MAG: nuclear transport factor 2 family protein [Allomuricauda sp.]|jgi:ketosteroid isomerase-like protein